MRLTMPEWEDYYKTLQVHFMAEPEIIQSAYKRLSRKYHPDVNRAENAEEMMKSINRAYEVLSNPISRKQYLIKWMERYRSLNAENPISATHMQIDFSIGPIKKVLIDYMNHILNKNFEAAFRLLSENDKKYISKRDFVKWRSLVAEVFELKSFECSAQNAYSDIEINNCFFGTAVEFNVKVVELNSVMERLEEDDFLKSVVFENNAWKIFLGYKELDSIIDKFNELADIKKQKELVKEGFQKRQYTDRASGLLNKLGFDEKAESEQIRHNRYGSKFSIIVCEINSFKQWPEVRLGAVRQIAETIRSNLRSLDILCRWKGKKYIILLPETSLFSAKKVAAKIQKSVCETRYGPNSYSLSFVVEEQNLDSLDKLIKAADTSLRQLKTR